MEGYYYLKTFEMAKMAKDEWMVEMAAFTCASFWCKKLLTKEGASTFSVFLMKAFLGVLCLFNWLQILRIKN